MYQLPCSSCSAIQHVSLAKAGDQITCDECGSSVAVPKLGELKQLAPVEEAVADRHRREAAEASKSPLLFVSLGLVSVAALLIGGYCGLRWALMDTPITTESHIEEFAKGYSTVAPAVLIREYESMEKYGLELAGPMGYVKVASQKREWGTNAVIAGVIGLLTLAAAFMTASRRNQGGM